MRAMKSKTSREIANVFSDSAWESLLLDDNSSPQQEVTYGKQFFVSVRSVWLNSIQAASTARGIRN
jgi:hypothetical protein